MAQDYWWVTRPKRKLNSIPEGHLTSLLSKNWNGPEQNVSENAGTHQAPGVELMQPCFIVWAYGLKRMKRCS